MAAPAPVQQAAKGQALGPALPRARRQWALAVGGGLVVVVCALVFAAGWAHAGHRQPVLALARPLAAGQLLQAADLAVVDVSVSGPAALVPAGQQASVVGRPVAAGLPVGALLAPGDIGPPQPGPGQQELGVAVKPGQYPPDLSAGQSVDVLATPAAPQSGATSAVALPVGQAVVVAVGLSAVTGVAVVELRLSQDMVPQVAAAAAAGQVTLATIAAGG